MRLHDSDASTHANHDWASLRETVIAALSLGASNLTKLQKDDGNWHIYNGAAFLLPLYVEMRHTPAVCSPALGAGRMVLQHSQHRLQDR